MMSVLFTIGVSVYLTPMMASDPDSMATARRAFSTVSTFVFSGRFDLRLQIKHIIA